MSSLTKGLTTGLAARVAIRAGVGVTLAVSGVIHAYLYVHGYRHIAMIGPSFLLQASVSCALAVLILAGGPKWLQWAGGALAAASLAAFVLSRTVGLVSFSEAGWQPAPEAALSVVAEVLTVAFVAAATITGRGSA